MNQTYQQVLDQILEHVRGVARFRWQAMIAAWVVCIAGWIGIAFMPNMYAASARVYVDTRTSLAPVLQGLAINQDVGAQLNLVRQSLLGRPQLERVAREADLDLKASTPQARARLLDRLTADIRLDGRDFGGGTVFTVGYQSANRETSIKVVEILLNSFVEDTLGGKRTGTETAQAFLREQIQDYEQRLREAEQRLADFKRRNVGQMPGAQGDYFSRLQAEMQAVAKAKGQLAVATTRRDELQRQLRGEKPSSGAVAPISVELGGETSARLTEAQARLDDLLLRFTDRHPDVIAARETVAQLQNRREEERRALQRGDSTALLGGSSSASPILQSIQLALNEAEVNVAALRSEVADHERSVTELRQLVDVVPEVEADFARLNRDYDVTRSQYNALLDRLEKSRLGEQAETAESIRFEVIDPPTADFEPVAPNRPLLMVAVLILGIGAGGALAFLLHMLKPVFHSSRTLNEVTGIPVLGVVSMTWLERYKNRRRRSILLYASSAVLLVAMCVVSFKLQGIGMQLAQRLLG